MEAAVPEPATLSQSLAAGRSRAPHWEMRPEFPLCGEGSWDSLPTAGLCCWCYVASSEARRDQRRTGKRSVVVVRSGGREKNVRREEESPLKW